MRDSRLRVQQTRKYDAYEVIKGSLTRNFRGVCGVIWDSRLRVNTGHKTETKKHKASHHRIGEVKKYVQRNLVMRRSGKNPQNFQDVWDLRVCIQFSIYIYIYIHNVLKARGLKARARDRLEATCPNVEKKKFEIKIKLLLVA